jgi:hypothetical protein
MACHYKVQYVYFAFFRDIRAGDYRLRAGDYRKDDSPRLAIIVSIAGISLPV